MAAGRALGGQLGQGPDEVLAAGDVEAGIWLVEDEQVRVGHQGSGDERPLPFTARKGAIGPLGKGAATELLEERPCSDPIVRRVAIPPRVEGAPGAGDHDLERRPIRGDERVEGGTGQADPGAHLADVEGAQTSREQLDLSVGRHQVAGGDAQQGRLAGAVRSQHDPALSGLDGPVDGGQDGIALPPHADAGERQDRRRAAWPGVTPGVSARDGRTGVRRPAGALRRTVRGRRRRCRRSSPGRRG